MNKTEFLKELASKTQLSQKDAKKALESVLEMIISQVELGVDVDFMGFGKFTFTEKSARKGRNPQTGESLDIDAKCTPKFKPGKEFRDRIANAGLETLE
jgi:DNA-binding protein HU-beta